MIGKPPCRRCLLAETDAAHIAETVQKRIAQMPEEERTAPPEYARRLSQCRACDMLTDGLCGVCGCYAELRAAKAKQHCPDCVPRW